MSATSFAPLAEALLPARENRLVRGLLLAVAGIILLTLSARIQVPFYPVPMTMQTFVVLVLGAAYGARLGAATVVMYLAVGALGLPVFANTPEKGVGIAYMVGTTGGYLLGFVVAAYLTGWLAERGWDRSVPRLAAAMFAGHLVIHTLGFSWLAYLLAGNVERAWMLGVAPFYLADLFKTALGAVTLPAAWSIFGRR